MRLLPVEKVESMVHRAILSVVLGVVLVASASCASKKGVPLEGAAGEQPAEDALRAEYEAKLAKVARHYLESEMDKTAVGQRRVIKKKPYYLKEYAEYPEIPDEFDIEMQETESRSRPYYAEVKLPKVRYSTRMYRKRREARRDDSFLRDVGEATLSFELRNGRWQRVGSMFIADTSEENVNGEWVPAEIEIKRTELPEEEQRWFFRTFKRVFHRKNEK